MFRNKGPKWRIVAAASTSALVLSGITAVGDAPTAQSQPIPPEIARLLPQEIDVAGRQIPVTPPLIAAIGAIPALAALIGAIIATSNGGSSEMNGSSGSSRRPRVNQNPMPSFVETEQGIKLNEQARNIDSTDALNAFGENGAIIPQATHALTKDQANAIDVEVGRIYSVPPTPGLPEAGFILVESLDESPDGNVTVTTREAFLDEVLLETNGPVALPGKPDYSAYKDGLADVDGVSYSVQPATDQFTSEEDSLREELTYTLKKRSIKGLEISGTGSLRLDPIEFNLDLSWRQGVKRAKLAVNPNATLEPELSIPMNSGEAQADESATPAGETDKKVKRDRCSESNEDKVAQILLQKDIPVRFTVGTVVIWADISPCIDVSVDWSLNQELSWKPKLRVSKAVGAQYSDEQSPRFQLINSEPSFEGSEPNLHKAELAFNGKAKASLNPTFDVAAYKLIGVKGSVPLSATATAGISFTPKQGTVCSVDLAAKPGFAASFGPKVTGKKQRFFGWLSLLHAEEDLWSKEFPKNVFECPVYKNQTVTGRVLELTNRDVSDSTIGANGEHADSRYYVLQLDEPTEITAKSAGDRGAPDRREVERILLGSITRSRYGTSDNRGDWPKYVTKRVTFDFPLENAWWPSDTRMPVGMVSVHDVQNFGLLSDENCTADAFSTYDEHWQDSSRLRVLYCDGNFAQVGVDSTDWIVEFRRIDHGWEQIPAAGHVRNGLYRPCYTVDGLRKLGAIDAFINRLVICKAEDLGYV